MSRHILILVENLSVPFDRRVWQESSALVEAGYRVTVICPMGATQDCEPDATLDGVLDEDALSAGGVPARCDARSHVSIPEV